MADTKKKQNESKTYLKHSYCYVKSGLEDKQMNEASNSKKASYLYSDMERKLYDTCIWLWGKL